MVDVQPPEGCAFRAENVGDHLLVTAVGAMDHNSADAVAALADNPLNTSRRIILDLAGVTYVDSGGIYALVALHRRLLGLELRNATQVVANVLRLGGLDALLV
jgi:anti-anti-sigma factor